MTSITRFRRGARLGAPFFFGAAVLVFSACSASHPAPARSAAPAERAELSRRAAPPARAAALSDAELMRAVERRLARVGGLPLRAIAVNAQRGIVTLQGQVNRGSERALAADTAVRTKGVRAVVNRLLVAPSAESDLAQEIRTTMQNESARAFANVTVAAQGSRIELGGCVSNPDDKERAERAAWFVGGVTEVDNQIEVRPGFQRSDQEIAEAVARSLHTDAYLASAPLKFSVKHGRVHLSGRVHSAFEKQRARARAGVAGVIAVSDDDVRVLPHAELQPEYAARAATDRETASAIRDAFRSDPRVPGTSIGLRVEYGVVSLLGSVSTLQQKVAAGEDARNARGTAAVVNRLEVHPGVALTPQGLQQQVLARLRAHPSVSADSIRVTVKDNKVVLQGGVTSRFEREAAERATGTVPGVVAIENRLEVGVTPRNYRDDDELKAQVERGLFADPRVAGARIGVNVQRGIVTVRGEAANPEVYDAVLERVFRASPRGVVNELWMPEPERFVFSD